MPIGNGSIENFIREIENRLYGSPDLIIDLGNRLSEQLQLGFMSSALVSRSGSTIKALSHVGEPHPTGNGWSIGVGDASMAGNENDPAPEGTLREFYEDNPEISPGPWKFIPRDYQQKLEQMRRAGMYGGSLNNARYMWVQDKGSATAFISARNYIEPSLERWRAEVPYFMRKHINAKASGYTLIH